MKKLIIIFISALFTVCSAVYPQTADFFKHELSVGLGGGLSGVNYNPSIGSQKNGFGGHFGLGYHYFFSPNWGLLTGVDLALYNGKFDLNDTRYNYRTKDYAGADFEFRSTINAFDEKQRAMMLQIPLMAQYQSGIFYAAAGAKVAIPLTGKYESKGNFANVGYYEDENFPYYDDPLMGFSTYNGRKEDGSFDVKTAFLAALEAGVKLNLNSNMSLYIGAYLDYGLNNIKKSDLSAHFVEYKSQERNFVVHSAVQSQYLNGTSTKAFTDKLAPMAVGLKVRLSLGVGGSGRQTTVESPAPQPRDTRVDDQAARRVADEEAARRAADEAARRAADEAAEAARRAIEDAAAREQALEEARRTNVAYNNARDVIQKPTDGYDLNESILDARQGRELDDKIALLRVYPNIRIYVIGHTCDTGNDVVNQRVGMERAERARAYLVANGV